MRKIRIIEQISLDGVIQAPGRRDEDGDYAHGGWAMPYFDAAIGEAISAAQGRSFDLLLGRRTYDIFAGYWPKVENDPIADGLNAATKYAPNASKCLGQSGACNGGCDPTNVPGYSVTTANNLLGSITHNQLVDARTPSNPNLEATIVGITEVALSDDGGGDPTNLIYLQNQCGALVGNGTGGGICNCPTE